MVRKILSRLRGFLRDRQTLDLVWVRRDTASWLAQHLPASHYRPPTEAEARRIEAIAARTQQLGPQPLWQGYGQVYAQQPDVPWAGQSMHRTSEQVRSQPAMGRLFSWLARAKQAAVVLEVGTAFGVSGMYWLTGLREGGGHLLTFDPNDVWHRIACDNLAQISPNFTAVLGTVEDEMAACLAGRRIDIAFIDAIHTSAFVQKQLLLILPAMQPGGIVVLDDITFSDDMWRYWLKVADDSRFRAAVAVGQRVGLLELAG